MFVRKIRFPFLARRKHSRIFLVLLLQLIAVGAIFICYSFSTQITVAALMLADSFDLPIGSQVLSATDYDRISDSWESFYSDSSEGSGSGDNLILGESGASGMLINKMQSGMYKELLEIIKLHCDGDALNPELPEMTMADGEFTPTVSALLGFHLCESGATSDGLVHTTLDPDKYDPNDGKHDLYNYNSSVASSDGGSSVNSRYMDKMNLYWGSTAFRTHLNFNAGCASIYPAGRYTRNPSTDSTPAMPSLLNGYGIDEGTVRTTADTDGAYFPDQIAISLEKSVFSMANSPYFDTNTMSSDIAGSLMYYIFNCGTFGAATTGGMGTLPSTLAGPGFTPNNWNKSNTMSYGEAATAGVTEMIGPADEIMKAMLEHYDEITAGVWDSKAPTVNISDYEGMAYVAMKLKYDVFTVQAEYNNLIKRLDNNQTAMVRGGTIAYRALTGDYSATIDEVKEFMYDIDVEEIPSAYGGYYREIVAYPGNVGMSFDYYWYSPNVELYNTFGQGPMSALRFGGFRARGPYASLIGGTFLYMYTLQACGVECTFADAYADANGLLIQQAPDNNEGGSTGGGGNSTTMTDPTTGETIIVDNSSLASAAVSYAWPTTAQAKGNDGTKLYQAVFDIVLAGDIYRRSCDRSVAAAVRWAGYDDGYPAGDCAKQEAYLVTSAKWEEIDWGGDVTKLQPGDILVATPGTWGPHTVLFVGYELPKKIHNVSANVVEGSLSTTDYANKARSPGCTTATSDFIGTLTLYRAFRNVQRETNSIYVNVPIKLE